MPAVESAGTSIHYEVSGEGPAIVLVHGFASSFARNWNITGWVDSLTAASHRVIGLDCRGHGQSGKPHGPAAYAGHAMADDVIAVMDAAGVEMADVMGYSMGGSITLDLVARHPARLRKAIVGGAGLRGQAIDPTRRAILAEAFEAEDPATLTNPMAKAFRRFADRSGENDRLALAAVQRADRAAINEAEARAIALPVLVVCGDKDDALPASERLVDAAPTARLVTLPGEDHLSAVLARGYKDAVLAFLKEP